MDTRTRALDLARHYLQTLGFNGFSFQTIADSLGIRKASLHYYFASKEDLGIALLEEYRKAYEEWTASVAKLTAHKKLEQMFKIFYKMSLDNNKICPAGGLSADFNSLSVKMKKKLLEFHTIQRSWLIETLQEGVQEKSLKKKLAIEETADLILAAIQGGVQIARMRGETQSFKASSKNLLASISA